ncbi:GNAT family N-acetyltransferase [Rarobacter faecitabidus]|uniref:Acyl-CoA synthetase (NDP forming) n=1 Tax=Rarobacter faecitabidus TaxID=13243 RepID=A0A542ZVE7_RARFA|nr:acyl-CoA synthetase (NDP forming) [Rarobacter faecitabidus]
MPDSAGGVLVQMPGELAIVRRRLGIMDVVVGARWDADVLLADGTTARIRPITPADAPALQRFHRAQSEQSTLFRFFAPRPNLSAQDLTHLTTVDYDTRVALVVLGGGTAPSSPAGTGVIDPAIIGVGRFDRYEDGNAEIAFNVADSQQGRGVGSILLEHLAAIGRELGVVRFTAEVLPGNGRMLSVFDAAGYRVSKKADDGVVLVEIELDPTLHSATVMADREWRADVASLERFQGARRIAVVGDASRTSARILEPLRRNVARSVGEFIFVTLPDESCAADPTVIPAVPVPSAAHGVALDDAAGADLVLVASEPQSWPVIIDALGAAGLAGAVLYQSADPDRPELVAAALQSARRYGVRVLGPGSAGFRVTRADGTLDVTTIDLWPSPEGVSSDASGVAVFCHSAGIAATLAFQMRLRGIRVANFYSAGQRADISGSDFLQLSAGDPRSSVVAMHLESLGNARKLARAIRRVAASQPLIVSASATAGLLPVPGHKVRTSAHGSRTLDYLLGQSGAIRAADVVNLADLTALALAGLRPTTDAVVVESEDEVQAALAAAEFAAQGFIVEAVHGSTSLDAQAAGVIVRVIDPAGVGGVTSRVGGRLAISALDNLAAPTPAFASARRAARCLNALRAYSRWLERDPGALVRIPADRSRARTLLRNRQPGALSRDAAADLLACYGIDLWPVALVEDKEAAVDAARELGFPIALTSSAPSLRHRSDLGAVRLGISSEAELGSAFDHMRAELARLDPAREPLRVQRMAPTGMACVIRSREDGVYGPVVSCGVAGDAVDLLGDLAEIVIPATEADIENSLSSLRAARRFFDPELPRVDIAGVVSLLARVGELADDNPEVARLELRPVVVSPSRVAVLDARIELGRSARTDDARRHLARWG